MEVDKTSHSLQSPQHHHWHVSHSCLPYWSQPHSPAFEETTTMLPLLCFSMGKAATLRTT